MSDEPTYEKGQEAWNVAQGYTQLKILKPLVEMDKLIRISKYGTENIEEKFLLDDHTKTLNRIEALHRLTDTLREIIENSTFAMNKKSQPVLQELDLRIRIAQDLLPQISQKKTDQRNGITIDVINENIFSQCLEKLRTIKQEIIRPLNDNSLVFPQSEEIDLDKLKNNIIEGG